MLQTMANTSSWDQSLKSYFQASGKPNIPNNHQQLQYHYLINIMLKHMFAPHNKLFSIFK